MNLKHMRYLLTIAEEKNITAAAKKLYVSQPSLSACIKNIEEDLGTEIFDRSTTPLELTPAGEVYLRWVRNVLNSEYEMKQKLSDVSSVRHSEIRIGASFERIRNAIYPILREFSRQRPHCEINLYENYTSNILEMLKKKELDIAILSAPEDNLNYSSIPIREEVPLLAVPSAWVDEMDDPPENLSTVSLSRFSHLPFVVLSSEQTFGIYFRKCCDLAGFIPDIRAQCRMLHTLHDMVRINVGAGLVTSAFIQVNRDDEHVRYFYLNNLPASRDIYAIYRNGQYLSKDAQLLVKLLKEQAEKITV
ncbi:MAG: LysR family transcriptional regulator [Lachnospiraceae bacterium]|nr:LysR family transcriptional regulator [Lachnospiraceae bacterium]